MTKKISELRELPDEELRKQLAETQREMFNLRFQRETEQAEKPAEIRAAKKRVARIKTVLHERELQKLESRSSSP
jgi:large subunit ribosomal protein L29